MSIAEAKELEDKAAAEKLVASVPLMPEIDSVDVELYTDHTGDPSFQVIFHVKRGVEPTNEFLDRFLDYQAVVQTKILHSDLGRFPYTRLEEAA